MKPKYNYPQQVVVATGNGGTRKAVVMDTQINKQWNQELRQHVPNQVMYLVNFGDDCAYWCSEEKIK